MTRPYKKNPLRIGHSEEIRAKIQTSQLLNRLRDHVLGSCEMSPTQVRAAEILLRKTMPDLSSTDVNVRTISRLEDLSEHELTALSGATGGTAGTAEASDGALGSDRVH